jgi:hypothetical protein
MVKRFGRLAAAVMLLALPSCEFVGPTASPESVITISANPLAIGLNGQSIVTVIVSQADGNPPPRGTLVFLTATLGTIASQVELSNGRATATLLGGTQAGVATVTAQSGAAGETSLDVLVGAVLDQIVVVATPASLQPGGGDVQVKAVALGDDSEPLANVPIVFSTTAGTLASEGEVVRTNAAGEAADVLTTTGDTTVTATSGAISGTAMISVEVEVPNLPPTAGFAVSPTSPRAGQQVFFNAATSTDSDGTIVSYEWDFGDGNSGSGLQTSHVYAAAQSFVVVLRVTDDDGATAATSSTVVVTMQ